MNRGPTLGSRPAGWGSADCYAAVAPAPARTPEKLAMTARFHGSRDQVRRARRFAAQILDGWPGADDLVLCLSEFAANAVEHSASGKPGGTFWVHVTAVPGDHIRVEVCDQGGPWIERTRDPERPHGLDVVRLIATAFGVDGDAGSGRIAWARLDMSKAEGHAYDAVLTDCSGPAVAGASCPAENGGATHADGERPWRG